MENSLSEKAARVNTSRAVHLCTLFDKNFLIQGLALIESVSAQTTSDVSWTVLALDSESYLKLFELRIPNLNVLDFNTLADADLIALVGVRPWRELCWTSAACLLAYTLRNDKTSEFVGYVDADCYFFGDISEMLDEIPISKSFAIHEHNFSADRKDWETKSGRFNVGVIIGRKSAQFIYCINRWRINVLDRCDVDQASGRCGDQSYLNSWPGEFSDLYIFEQPGVGVAPWNLNNFEISEKDSNILVDGLPIYFFHFHGLKVGFLSSWLSLIIPASGYKLSYIPWQEIYSPYIDKLMKLKASEGLTKSRRINSFNWYFKNGIKNRIYIASRLTHRKTGLN